MLRVLYSLTLYLTFPIWAVWMLRRAKARNQQPDWRQRFGHYDNIPAKTKPRIWFHAVSVGEVMAAKPIIEQFRQLKPNFEIVVSCTTTTGFCLADQSKHADILIYFPIDLPHVCKRAMKTVQPDIVAILETEIWFNFLHYAKKQFAAAAIVNGRISDRSFADAVRVRWFYKKVFRLLDACLMQTETDAKRARFFGAKAEIIGNSKYDVQLPQQGELDCNAALDLKEGEPLVVFGSIRGEEEENLTLDAIANIQCKVLFAPRHIERAEQILSKAQARNLSAGRFSLGETDARLVILDQIGLLSSAYSRASAAVIGGGFAPLGGQNIIEPLSAGCPVICGPHMHNFRQPFEEGVRTGAVLAAADSAQIARHVQQLLADPARQRAMGEAGRRLVEQHRGSAKKYALRLAALANSPDSKKQGVSEKPMR